MAKSLILYERANTILGFIDRLLLQDPTPSDDLLVAREHMAAYRDQVKPDGDERKKTYREG
jgi:hypothetical protein